MVDERAGAPPRASFRGAATRLADSALLLARTHAELAAVELEEERDRMLRSGMLLAGAVFMLSFAVLGLAAWVVAYFWDTHRLEAIAIVTLVFAGAGGVLFWRNAVAERAAPTPFAATLAELDKDRAWFAATRSDIE